MQFDNRRPRFLAVLIALGGLVAAQPIGAAGDAPGASPAPQPAAAQSGGFQIPPNTPESVREQIRAKALELEKHKEVAQKAADADARASDGSSAWVEAEKTRYRSILQKQRPELVVVPFQVASGERRFGVDLSARVLMAYATAQSIGIADLRTVADVAFVSKALGDPRHLTREEAVGFGRFVAAKLVLYGEVSYDERGRLDVSLVAVSPFGRGEPKLARRAGIQISDRVTPELAYRSVATALLKDLGIKIGAPQAPAAEKSNETVLPASPLEAIRLSASNALEGLWLQQLLGALHAEETPRARAAAFERALAGLDYVGESSPDRGVLKARALFYLGRRPAALESLGNATGSPEALALIEYMNGNLAEMQRVVPRIARRVPRLIAEIELLDLRARYGIQEDTLRNAAERLAASVPEQWAPLVIWRAASLSNWQRHSAIEVKLVLDAHFPLKDYTAEQVVRGKSVGPSDRKRAMEIEASAFEHAAKTFMAFGGEWCCGTPAWQTTPYQYLQLLESHAEAILLRSVDYLQHTQGLSEDALQLADLISDVVFHGGNAELELRKAVIWSELIQQSPRGPGGSALARRLYHAAKSARQWTNDPSTAGQASDLERKGWCWSRPDCGWPAHYPDLNELKSDFPPNAATLWWTSQSSAPWYGTHLERLERACGYTEVKPEPCEAWRAEVEMRDDVPLARRIEKEQLVERFRGSPQRLKSLVATATSRGDVALATQIAREQLQLDPGAWSGYEALGSVYLSAGEYDRAAKTYLSYPGFGKTQNRNTVDLSIHAASSAYGLAMRGATREARELYRIAALYPDGSNSSMSATMNLANYERRFGDAARMSEARMQRYGSEPTVVRSYVSLLFALGESDQAWLAARDATARLSDFRVWLPAQVGLRMAGADARAVTDWAMKVLEGVDLRRRPDTQALNALTIAIQTLAIDRPASSVEAISGVRDNLLPATVPPKMDWEKVPEARRDESRDAMAKRYPPLGREDPKRLGLRRDYLARFALGYAKIKSADYNGAWEAFQNWAKPTLLPESYDPYHAAVAYHAYAAVKSGHADEFKTYLDARAKPAAPLESGLRAPPFPVFDVHLARAVLAAFGGDHVSARKHLTQARASIPETGTRPIFPEYVYAEICELLGAQERLPGYLPLVVEWSRAYQMHQPWAAWPYVFEAKYSNVDADRVRALAIGRYLDGKSARLATLDSAFVRRADAWLTGNKPFPRNGRTPSLKQAL